MFLDLFQWQSPFQQLTQTENPPLLQLGERSAARLRGRGNPASTLVATANARPLPWAAGTSLFRFQPSLGDKRQATQRLSRAGEGATLFIKTNPLPSSNHPRSLSSPSKTNALPSAHRKDGGAGGVGVVSGHLTQDPGAVWNRGNPRTMSKV